MKLKTFRTRDIVLIFALILILFGSYYVQQAGISMPSVNINNYQNQPQTETPANESQGGYVPDTSTGRGLCEQGCNDLCQIHPNTPFIAWEEITPPGSTKNCKTILEEELGVPDLSTCEQCKCVCYMG